MTQRQLDTGRLSVTAPKKGAAINGRERLIPIEGPSSSNQGHFRSSSRSSGGSQHDSGTGSLKNGDGGGRRTESRASTTRTTQSIRKAHY
uniref:Uncharacterized protein n=1 Tax=Plectus sambesii TaxID=2011161 RepID=A0A914WNG2_9BILA